MNLYKQIKFIAHYSEWSKRKLTFIFIYFLFSALIQVGTSFFIKDLVDSFIDNVDKQWEMVIIFTLLTLITAICQFIRKNMVCQMAFSSEIRQ